MEFSALIRFPSGMEFYSLFIFAAACYVYGS